MLIEDMPDLPGKNSTDANPLGGRKQFESGKSPDEYLRIQQDDPVYNHESFFTPESWLAYFLTHLVETDQAIDNYNGEDGVRYLATAYFPDTCKVPDGSWNIDDCQADLEVSSPSKADESCGIAAIVRIT
jgi:hypothetical protein